MLQQQTQDYRLRHSFGGNVLVLTSKVAWHIRTLLPSRLFLVRRQSMVFHLLVDPRHCMLEQEGTVSRVKIHGPLAR